MDNFLVNALLMILQELIDGHEDMLGDTELNCFRMIRNVRASSPTINDPIQAIHRSDLVVMVWSDLWPVVPQGVKHIYHFQ